MGHYPHFRYSVFFHNQNDSLRDITLWSWLLALKKGHLVVYHTSHFDSHVFYFSRSANIDAKDNNGCGYWLRAGQMCVGVGPKGKTWAEARTYCQSYNGDLIKVNSLDKMVRELHHRSE